MTFDDFTRARLPALLRFAKVLCVDRGTAEDVVQEVLLRAHGRWSAIENLDQPEVYVRRMIVNEYLSWRRKWSRLIPTAEPRPDHGEPDSADQLVNRDELIAGIARLPRRQRAVVVLRFYGGLTDTEIAEELGCRNGTVRSHLSRALATLRVQIDETEASVDERLAH